MKLNGKVALITGGGQGIGQAIALVFAQEGADVAVNALHLSTAEDTAAKVRKLGRKAVAIETDVAEIENVDRMVDRTLDELGRIDILVNAAGSRPEIVPTIKQSLEQFDLVIRSHLRGTYLCCRQVARWMLEHGGGKIVNISSVAGINAHPMRTGYGSAKAGIIHLTKTLAVEWANQNINVNCIAPGFIMTPRIEWRVREGMMDLETIKKRVPMGRLGEPKDIGYAALFLVSDEAKYITGINLLVDGGWVAYGYY